MDNIFNTEQNEFQSNRQNAKILYLQNQNAILQEDIEDLQNSIKLNKVALELSYQQQKKMTEDHQKQIQQLQQQIKQLGGSSANNSTKISSENNTATEKTLDSGNQQTYVKQNEELLEKIINENKNLVGAQEKLRNERNLAQTRALIQEQIQEENSNFQKEVVTEQDEKILELRRIIHDKEYAIQEFEKLHPQSLPNGTVLKVREIITPNDQCIKLHQEIENLRYAIKRLTSENHALTHKNAFLLDFNTNLKREAVKIRTCMGNPINFQGMKQLMYDNQSIQNDENLELQKYFYKEYFKNDEDESIARDFVSEIKYQQDIERMQEQRQQQQGMKNQNFLLSRDQLLDKIDALEHTITNYNALYARETENNKMLQEDITELQRHNREVLQYNEILIQSNKQHQERVIQQHREIDLYKGYYYKYMEFIKNRRKMNLSLANNPLNVEEMIQEEKRKRQNLPNNYAKNEENTTEVAKKNNQQQQEQKQVSKKDSKKQIEENIEVNVSILDEDEEEKENNLASKQDLDQNIILKDELDNNNSQQYNTNNNNNNNILNQVNKSNNNYQQEQENHEMNILQCKKYLLNLAKDLYINLSKNNSSKGITRQVLKRIQLGQGNPGMINLFRSKRSQSNPLEYTSKEFQHKAQIIPVHALDALNQQQEQQQQQQRLNFTKKGRKDENNNNNANNNWTQMNQQQQEMVYQHKTNLYTQVCNYDYEEQHRLQKGMICIAGSKQNQGSNHKEFQFKTEMGGDAGGGDYQNILAGATDREAGFGTNHNLGQYNNNTNLFSKQNPNQQQQQGMQSQRVNVNIPFEANIDHIESKKPAHQKKITMQFVDGDSFMSEDLNL